MPQPRIQHRPRSRLGHLKQIFTKKSPELISRQGSSSPRRISGASSGSGYYSNDRERTSIDSGVHGQYKSQHWRYSFRRCEVLLITTHYYKYLLQLDGKEQRDSKEEKDGMKDKFGADPNSRTGNYHG